MGVRLAAAIVAVVVGTLSQAHGACQPATGAAREMAAKWANVCTSPMCGTVLDARRMDAHTTAPQCPDDAWRAMTTALTQTRDAGGIILLGEVHDNPNHHAFRAKLIDALFEGADKRPGVVMEHVRADQKAALAVLAIASGAVSRTVTTGTFFKAMDWAKSGWPDQRIFAPLIETLFSHRLPILPGEPARGAVRDLSMKGLAALAADDPLRPSLARPLPDILRSALLDELEASHCGLMPRTAFGGMALAQRYRDAFQARALIAARRAYGWALLLAGNGHVRTDRGAPFYLRERAPSLPRLVVQLVESDQGKREARDYVRLSPAGKPTADFFVITPPTERQEACTAMRERFKRPSEGRPPAARTP